MLLSYKFYYFYVFIYLLVSILLTTILFVLSWVVSPKNRIQKKNSSYECGFVPFNDSRSMFEINFFLIGILFIVFDLELAFLFPWAVSLNLIGIQGFFSVVFFILILFIGFFFEWTLGGFDFKDIKSLRESNQK